MSRMFNCRFKSAAIILFLGILVALAVPMECEAVDLPRFPSISPDGEEIVFSSGGDLWLVSLQGGLARRLTSHNLDDLHSSWSPDGEAIVFTSMRDGYMNLWRIQRDGTRTVQLTHSDRFMRNPDWAMDHTGQSVITFSGMLEADVYRSERPYKLLPEGGQHHRLHEAFGSEPRLSPDGRQIVFTRGGYYHDWNRRHYRGPDAMNIWIYMPEEEKFTAVTDRDGDDGMARWIDDHSLIFLSDRESDTVNLYRADLHDEKSSFHRLTDFKGTDINYFDVARNGHTAVIQVWDSLYTLDLQNSGAEPRKLRLRAGNDGRDNYVLRRIDRDITEAVLSPDGEMMAYTAYGRVYVRHMDEHSPTRALTPNTHARHQDLAWSPDGLWLYFTSDADGTLSIYKALPAKTRREILSVYEERTQETKNGLLASHSFTPISFELIESSAKPYPYLIDAAVSNASYLIPEVHEDPFAPREPLHLNDPDDPEPTPCPPYAQPSLPEQYQFPEPGDDLPQSLDPGRWHDAVQFWVLPVVVDDHNDRGIQPSPDGNRISFRRDRGDLMVMDLNTGKKTTLVEGWDTSLQWRWSPDGRYLAYTQNDLNFSANIFIVPADGSHKPVNITRHPRNDLNPRWSADGRKLSFISNRSGGSYDLYRVYLDPEMENWTRRELINYYREAKNAADKLRPLMVKTSSRSSSASISKSNVNFDLENAWKRVERVTNSPENKSANEMTPGGDRYVFNSRSEGLVAVNWDGTNRKRLGPMVNVQQLDITGDNVIYISNGRAGVVSLNGGTHRRPDISDRIRIDLRQQSLQKFNEAARVIEEGFYCSDMKGLDWQNLVAEYRKLVKKARTASEFSDITNRLMGELAASHTGISNPGPGYELRQPSGRLGIDYQPVRLDHGGIGYQVMNVLPGGPADRGPIRLKPGDIITGINLRGFQGRETLLKQLRGKVDQEVIVSFERPAGRERVRFQALLIPVSYSELAGLRYNAFCEASRRKVSELSQGRLGYIHIQAMNETSLEDFQAHLYAAAEGKDGLIIDVRNNGGGHTTDRILTSIMAPEHAYTIPVGADPGMTGYYPQGRLDAPRYTLPINMLANEKSYSNSEILAHAFRTLNRGTLVGQQTYGGVISTGRHTLIDGATVRRPFRGWFLPDGRDMEHNGAMPDLMVAQTPEDEIRGKDPQLEAAVEDLLERLEKNGELSLFFS